MKEVGNVLVILQESLRFVEEGDSIGLKALSNRTIDSATIYQDPDNILVAVLVYALGKVFERKHYQNLDGWNQFHGAVVRNLKRAINDLQKQDVEHARTHLSNIRNCLNKMSGRLKDYIKDVFAKAEINKAFKLYEHGISSKQTADLLGVSLWDLSSYIGQSSVSNAHIAISMPIAKRVRIAEEFFR